MKIEINKLAKHFADVPFQMEGIYRFTQKPGKSWPSYTEPFPGFVFPLNGKVEFTFDGTPYVFTPGKVIHGGAKMKLAEKKNNNTSWEYLLVHYQICGPDSDKLSPSSSHFELQVGYSLRLYDLLERLWKISFQSGSIPAFQTKVLFYNVLEEVFACARNQDNGNSKTLFDQVSAYIHEHYSESLAISMLSEQNGVSRNRLAYVFSKYSGMGPGDYLLSYRLNRAKEMLLVENMTTIQEISQAVGFNDPFYFSRAFKKQFGLSPREYRNKFINNPV
ncbi:AraC family transcriptional regulator [Clostridium sp. MSJ-4]|uniref:AraC family transcriptional regulator n=1 Tax=Clostridium simiarum TaxID=2841506 RepID=A0ABS6F4B9_9CLOT|nr:AraC family transcriptional regulator [Clostridium simiarum]MBU5592685.1 AraC family transcriptional regulator [Clostridium simiarum]